MVADPQAALFAAFAKAQSEMKNAPLNKVNPHFKSKYADLAAIREAVLPILNKNGIGVMQLPMIDESGRNILVTTLTHEGGGTIQSQTPVCADTSKPQAYMSALTYARRAGLASIATISADDDDDGNAAQAHAEKADPRFVSEAEEKALTKLIKDYGANGTTLCEVYGVTAISEMTPAMAKEATAKLHKKYAPAEAAE